MSVEKQIIQRVKEDHLGAFTANDFLDLHNYKRVSKALETLEDDGTIIRIRRGIYVLEKSDRPEKEELDVAIALARQGGWKIAPSHEMALRHFGLETAQKKDLYFVSTGPKRVVELGDTILHFRPLGKKEYCFKRLNNLVLYQVICHYNEKQIPLTARERIIENLDTQDRSELKTLYPYLAPKAKKGVEQILATF